MTKQNLAELIAVNKGFTIADITEDIAVLHAKALDILFNFEVPHTDLRKNVLFLYECTNYSKEVRSLISRVRLGEIHIPEDNISQAIDLWEKSVIPTLKTLTPQGFYFGRCYEDESKIGWYDKYEDKLLILPSGVDEPVNT